ncbi:MAG TPA: hypothetical protein VNZ64_16735 [Candidatus Acidoferrum sp.]|jgi:hypothetical protein|nr:hypothetical protein [Candidatus Acidoferrum sp.]
MKASDVFGLVVRVTGFLLIVYGLRCELYALGSIPSAVFNGGEGLRRSFNWFTYGLPIFAFGSVCLLCADWVVKLTYREPLAGSSPVVATGMKPWDIFGVVVRLLGVGLFLFAAWYLLYGVEDALGLSSQNTPREMRFYFGFGIPVALAGLALIRGASLVVRFSYRTQTNRDVTEPRSISDEKDAPE